MEGDWKGKVRLASETYERLCLGTRLHTTDARSDTTALVPLVPQTLGGSAPL
jgi:hypothetical protein